MTTVFSHCSLLCFPVKIVNLNSVQQEASLWFHCGSQQRAECTSKQNQYGNMETFRKVNLTDFVLLVLFERISLRLLICNMSANTQAEKLFPYCHTQCWKSHVLTPTLPIPLATPKLVFIQSCFEIAKREIGVEPWLSRESSWFNQTEPVKIFAGDA